MRSKVGRIALVVGVTALFAGTAAMPAAHAAVKKCFGKPVTLGSNATHGTAGSDVWVGTAGNNTFNGKGGNDFICGGGGSDGLKGAGGNDKIDGGSGDDGGNICQGPGAVDGGPGNDVLKGGSGDNCLFGRSGNDHLFGGPDDDDMQPGTGSDTLDGGANGSPVAQPPTGIGDTASFSDLPVAVAADLTAGTATSGGDTDTLANVENLGGTPFDDTLTANKNGGLTVNGIEGGPGNDTENGNGALIAIAAYLTSPTGVSVDFTQGSASDGWGGTDRLINMTGVAGSSFDDNIVAGGIIFGGGGADNVTLVAGSIVDLGPGDDILNVAVSGTDQIAGRDGNDTINSGGGDDQIDAGAGDDHVNSGDGNDAVLGGAGNDTLDGGAQTTFDAGSCGDGTDTGKNFEVDAVTQQPVGPTGRPADCEA